MDVTSDFKEHLVGLSEMELFYGDETIVGLLDHSKFLTEEIDEFHEIFSLSREETEQTPLEETDNEQPEGEEQQEEEKTIFYKSS